MDIHSCKQSKHREYRRMWDNGNVVAFPVMGVIKKMTDEQRARIDKFLGIDGVDISKGDAISPALWKLIREKHGKVIAEEKKKEAMADAEQQRVWERKYVKMIGSYEAEAKEAGKQPRVVGDIIYQN